MRLGNQLEKLREEQKMSQEEVAKQVGVSVQNIHKWENNQSYPEIQHLLKLGDIYATTIDEFIIVPFCFYAQFKCAKRSIGSKYDFSNFICIRYWVGTGFADR